MGHRKKAEAVCCQSEGGGAVNELNKCGADHLRTWCNCQVESLVNESKKENAALREEQQNILGVIGIESDTLSTTPALDAVWRTVTGYRDRIISEKLKYEELMNLCNDLVESHICPEPKTCTILRRAREVLERG